MQQKQPEMRHPLLIEQIFAVVQRKLALFLVKVFSCNPTLGYHADRRLYLPCVYRISRFRHRNTDTMRHMVEIWVKHIYLSFILFSYFIIMFSCFHVFLFLISYHIFKIIMIFYKYIFLIYKYI